MHGNAELPRKYVADSAQFSALCRQWQGAESLALDTEFVRTSTFYSNIGLLQIADLHTCYLVDPLRISDWTEFSLLLRDARCCFVIHSCSEDLNLLFTALKVLPARVFDTQLAAAFLNMGYSVSYQSLVSELLGIDVVKDETRSDWLRRPLTDTQIAYAAADVNYLLQLQVLLEQQLQDKGVLAWFADECEQRLCMAPEFEEKKNWQLLYAGFSNAWRLSDEGLGILQALCYWREQEARRRNKPRSWIAKDQDLLGIAMHLAEDENRSLSGLLAAGSVDRRLLDRYGNKLLRLAQSNRSDFASIDRGLLHTPLTAPLRKKLKACQVLVSRKAAELDIAPELLGRKKTLQELIRGFENSGQLSWEGELSGWRRQVLEADFTRVLMGEDQDNNNGS